MPEPLPIVYACSGCSDAGELADRIARKLTRDGVAEMSCLAGIGGRVKSLLAKGTNARRILVIDGCPIACAKKTLQLAGLTKFEHLGLHELGFRKGSCAVTDENIRVGTGAAAVVLLKTNT
ncbi:MAG: putative zinc-binding protein [Verrucomicrobiota bacterium]